MLKPTASRKKVRVSNPLERLVLEAVAERPSFSWELFYLGDKSKIMKTLAKLEMRGVLSGIKIGGYKLYFVPGEEDPLDRNIYTDIVKSAVMRRLQEARGSLVTITVPYMLKRCLDGLWEKAYTMQEAHVMYKIALEVFRDAVEESLSRSGKARGLVLQVKKAMEILEKNPPRVASCSILARELARRRLSAVSAPLSSYIDRGLQ
ncbi:MAG: hypothetical protein ACP5MH_11575 [Thermoproteus sp.]